MEIGPVGDGIYWDIVEMLYEEGGYLSIKDIPLIAKTINTTEELVKKVVLEAQLFKKDKDRFYSVSLLERLEHINLKRRKAMESGKLGGLARSKKTEKSSVPKEVKPKLTDTDFIGSLKSSIAYKHINIDIELARMDAWLLAHKGKQKTRRFIVNWLNHIDKGLPISEASQVSYQEKNKKPDPNCPLCGGKGKRYPNPNNKEISVSCNCWR